jgi:hypothetical protein
MRRQNAALLLNTIRDRGLVANAGLARSSGLTKPTICSQIAVLIERAFVAEDGERPSGARGLSHDLPRDLGHNEIQLSTMR